jgi:hypothetical protein
VYVIWHQGIAQDADLIRLTMAGERRKIPLPVASGMKDYLPVVPTLCHVVRYAGKDGTGAARHCEQIVHRPRKYLKKKRGLSPFSYLTRLMSLDVPPAAGM